MKKKDLNEVPTWKIALILITITLIAAIAFIVLLPSDLASIHQWWR